MADINHFVKLHEGEVFVVIGTGPSTWALGQTEAMKKALTKTVNIGVNRGFDAGHRVSYQVSLDQIWTALVRKPAVNSTLKLLRRQYKTWCTKYDYWDLTLEDWVYTFRDKLNIHDEVWRYLRLCSPHAPFVRFTTRHNARSAPFPVVAFGPMKSKPRWGVYQGLMTGGNSSPTAIHLAAVMGAKYIFLLGVDMTPPDKVARIWETGPGYYRPRVKKSFKDLGACLGSHVKIINLNHAAALAELQKVDSDDHALEMLHAAIGS